MRLRAIAFSGLAIAALSTLVGGVLVFSSTGISSAHSSDLLRPFAGNSPFNVKIPANPLIDLKSSLYATRLMSGNAVANTTDYSNAIYDNVTASTPREQIHITMDSRNGGTWGHNAMYGMSIPVPVNAVPPAGTDGTVVIVDRPANKTYYLWQFRRDNGRIVSSWPAVFALDGLGTTADIFGGRGTAAGISQLAGTIRVEEMKAGRIDHALAFATGENMGCGAPGPGGGTQNPNGDFRWPAQGTDGWVDILKDPTCLPYGIRVQLDPSLDLNDTTRFPNLTRGERIIGKAMQEYGAYLVDKSGASFAMSFEKTEPGEPTWCQLGLAPANSWACPTEQGDANYWTLKGLLDGKLRVLADCQCGTTKESAPVASGSPSSTAPVSSAPTSVAPPTAPVPTTTPNVNTSANLLTGRTLQSSVGSAPQGDFGSAKANDGNGTTRWISVPTDQVTLTADLGRTQLLQKIRIGWAGDTTKNYDVQMSADGASWTTVARGVTNNTSVQSIEHNSFLATPSGRHLRIVAKDRWNTTYGHSIYELEAFGTAVSTTTTLLSPTTSAAPVTKGLLNGKPVVSSAASAPQGDFAPSRANDNNPSTRWISTPQDNVTLTADLGSAHRISKVDILWAGDTTKSYVIQMSSDRKKWRSVARGVTNNATVQRITHTDLPEGAHGRYLRVVALDRWNGSYGHSIWEIAADGRPLT